MRGELLLYTPVVVRSNRIPRHVFLPLKIQQEKIPLKLSTLKVLTRNLLIVSK